MKLQAQQHYAPHIHQTLYMVKIEQSSREVQDDYWWACSKMMQPIDSKGSLHSIGPNVHNYFSNNLSLRQSVWNSPLMVMFLTQNLVVSPVVSTSQFTFKHPELKQISVKRVVQISHSRRKSAFAATVSQERHAPTVLQHSWKRYLSLTLLTLSSVQWQRMFPVPGCFHGMVLTVAGDYSGSDILISSSTWWNTSCLSSWDLYID